MLYFAPQDDCRAALLAVVQHARHTIRLSAYAYHLPPLTDLLIAKHQVGVDVACLFDAGQAATFAAMAAELARLRAAGVPFLVGTSPKRGILHAKFILVDGLTVAHGSYNFTLAAQAEGNTVAIEHSSAKAHQFAAAWQSWHDWIAAHPSQQAPLVAEEAAE